ncbi:deleted in lung and esophageal cancer protein 1-like [Montipora capricornis]|uniref:deleted in lung and esophageal cancer protein 1-like n=1 Tax=Montipora capricornis TaxID=246305 RepID=UPI0035F1AF3A
MLVLIEQPLPVFKDGAVVVPAVKEQDAPFIQIKLREHDGTCAKRPFDVTPSQQIILARGHSCAKVSFHPYTEKPSGEQCAGYVVAYMSLDDQGLKIPGRVHRLHGVEIRPFRVDMTAKIDPPLHNSEYECVVIVSGQLQEEEQRLVMRGRGSYDQTHERLVNVTTDT